MFWILLLDGYREEEISFVVVCSDVYSSHCTVIPLHIFTLFYFYSIFTYIDFKDIFMKLLKMNFIRVACVESCHGLRRGNLFARHRLAILLPGKPVAVTHSSGKGAARNRPGTNVEYERAYYQKKRETARGRGRKGMQYMHRQVCEGSGVDTEDGEDEDFDAVQAENQSGRPDMSNEEFFSMAEIASCSYEARQVSDL